MVQSLSLGNNDSHISSASSLGSDSGSPEAITADDFHPRLSIPPSLDAKTVLDDLYGRRSQLWSRDDISAADKLVFSALEVVSGLTCDAITRVLNTIDIENHDAFLGVYDKRDRDKLYGPDTGLLTAGNHSHYVDDPLIVAAFLRFRYMNALKMILGDDSEFKNWHWMPAAKENFFNHRDPLVRKIFRTFFGYTKTVPIARKGTVKDNNFKPGEQIAVRRLEELLGRGDWVNIFPEGTRAFKHGEMNPFKKGVGKLAVEAGENAVFLPFGHDGMENVSPMGAKMEVLDEKTTKPLKDFVRTGQRIQVVMGDPIVLRDMVKGVPHNERSYAEVTEFVRGEVERCMRRAIELNKEALEMADW